MPQHAGPTSQGEAERGVGRGLRVHVLADGITAARLPSSISITSMSTTRVAVMKVEPADHHQALQVGRLGSRRRSIVAGTGLAPAVDGAAGVESTPTESAGISNSDELAEQRHQADDDDREQVAEGGEGAAPVAPPQLQAFAQPGPAARHGELSCLAFGFQGSGPVWAGSSAGAERGTRFGAGWAGLEPDARSGLSLVRREQRGGGHPGAGSARRRAQVGAAASSGAGVVRGGCVARGGAAGPAAARRSPSTPRKARWRSSAPAPACPAGGDHRHPHQHVEQRGEHDEGGRLWKQRADSLIASSGATSCSITSAGANHSAIISRALENGEHHHAEHHAAGGDACPGDRADRACRRAGEHRGAADRGRGQRREQQAEEVEEADQQQVAGMLAQAVESWPTQAVSAVECARTESMRATSRVTGAAAQPKGTMPSAAGITKKISACSAHTSGARMKMRHPRRASRGRGQAPSPGAGGSGCRRRGRGRWRSSASGWGWAA